MEQAKSRCNSLLAFAVLANIIFTVTLVGFVNYKVRVLEKQVFQLQSRSSVNLQNKTTDNGNELTHRVKRSSDSLGASKSCVSCHNACVKLFGLGASAKVPTISLPIGMDGNYFLCINIRASIPKLLLIQIVGFRILSYKTNATFERRRGQHMQFTLIKFC